MLHLRSIVIGLALIGAAACSDDDGGGGGGSGGGASVAELCAMGCEKGATLSCPNEPADCVADCQANASAMQCQAEAQALLTCAANRPVSDYVCGDDGESTVVDTVCTSESTAFGVCVLNALGSAGMGGSGDMDCPFTNDGECDEPDFCPPGTDTADCS